MSANSKALLEYLIKPTYARDPVGYNQNFLRSYKPNRTWYLEKEKRDELFALGRAENGIFPAGTYVRKIMNRLLIDLSWNSSRLEGNTYSLLETKRLIELGENVVGKDITDAQMILNHKNAIEYIVESVEEEEKEITSYQVRSIHALLSENLLGDSSALGRVRHIAVAISDSTYLPLENPHLIEECFDLFIQKLNKIEDPFEQSFFALVHLSYLQTFEDVNKRTARIVGNIPLIQHNLKPLSFTDVPQDAYTKSLLTVYEKNDVCLFRDLYLWAYQRSAKQYAGVQQVMGESNILKLRYRDIIKEIIHRIVVEKVSGSQTVSTILEQINHLSIPEEEKKSLFRIIENEIVNLHEGNSIRFQIRPHQFKEWISMK